MGSPRYPRPRPHARAHAAPPPPSNASSLRRRRGGAGREEGARARREARGGRRRRRPLSRPAPASCPVHAGQPPLVPAAARLVAGARAPEPREPRGALAGVSAGPGRLTSGERASEGLPPQQSGERSGLERCAGASVCVCEGVRVSAVRAQGRAGGGTGCSSASVTFSALRSKSASLEFTHNPPLPNTHPISARASPSFAFVPSDSQRDPSCGPGIFMDAPTHVSEGKTERDNVR